MPDIKPKIARENICELRATFAQRVTLDANMQTTDQIEYTCMLVTLGQGEVICWGSGPTPAKAAAEVNAKFQVIADQVAMMLVAF